MTRIHGINTPKIGQLLCGHLDTNKYQVFYDNGDSSDSQVCQPVPYTCGKYTGEIAIDCVDIAVAKENQVLIITEIEENEIRPQIILDNIFSVAFADKIRLKDSDYKIDNTVILIAIVLDNASSPKQRNKYISLEKNINEYFSKIEINSKKIRKVRIITCDRNDIIRRLESLIRLEIKPVYPSANGEEHGQFDTKK